LGEVSSKHIHILSLISNDKKKDLCAEGFMGEGVEEAHGLFKSDPKVLTQRISLTHTSLASKIHMAQCIYFL
jgi:hypothetical protein